MLLSALLLTAAYSADPPLIVSPPRARSAEAIITYGLGIEAPAPRTFRIFAPPPGGGRNGRVETTRTYAWKTEAAAMPSMPAWCHESGMQRAENADASVLAKVTPLGELPQANHTLTVLRKVDGCPVSSTVRFNVGR